MIQFPHKSGASLIKLKVKTHSSEIVNLGCAARNDITRLMNWCQNDIFTDKQT